MEQKTWKNLSLENMPNEEWRDVVGYEGLYQVSNMGRIKSLERLDSLGRKINERILKQKICYSNGYCIANIYAKEGGHKSSKVCTIHRLIAKAFLENKDNRPCVDHINTIRDDNRLSNLKWVTYAENMSNPITRKRSIETSIIRSKEESTRKFLKDISVNFSKTKEAKEKWKKSISRSETIYKMRRNGAKSVLQIDTKGNVIAEYFSIAEAYRVTKACHISDVCRGIRPLAGGYFWKFKK